MQLGEDLAVLGMASLRQARAEDKMGHYVDCSDQLVMSHIQLQWQIVGLDRCEG